MTRARILVVEDERIVARDIQNSLTALGYSVPALASSGEQAIKQAEETHPDLVLMDIRLKGKLDGVEATEQIRHRFDIPVVYLTAHSDNDTLQRAKVTEPFGYVLKPFEERDLHVAIEMALYRHRLERKLVESERWLSTILMSITDAVIATDGEGCVTLMNPTAQALTGWKAERAVGQPLEKVFNVVAGKTGERIEDAIARVYREDALVSLGNDTLLVSQDRAKRPVEYSAAPIRGDNGEVVGTVVVFRDITERKRAEEALQQELDRLRSELIGNVSHELRTPLGLIKVFCTTLLREEVSFERETQREFLRNIDEEADRLERIVGNLLNLSRMESGRLDLDRRPTDIGRLAREAIEAVKIEMDVQSTQHRFAHDFPADPLVATVDAREIEQVLRNLLTNAVKYSPEGGTITIQGRRDEEQFRISVSDQGIGIPDREMEQVFERFYRVENEIIWSIRGAGLGLAVCRGIVEAHGGRIWVESILNAGSTFYFTLPLSSAAGS